MRRLLRPLWFLLALIFLVEAWIWDRLDPVVGWIVARLPFKALKVAIADGIARLPPYATLLVFAVPGVILVPFKLAGLWLIGGGHVLAGGFVFLLAKSVGLGVTAFLFHACQPKLMQIGWFVRLYDLVLRLRAWAHRQTEPARRLIARLRRRFGERRSYALHMVARLRRRAGASIRK
ncbi:MAG TPA: hypothetical protein PLE50_05475 [Rhabdaerophilum sp.]|nr:hypothetical protein [Rhabdaerophilum sp.]